MDMKAIKASVAMAKELHNRSSMGTRAWELTHPDQVAKEKQMMSPDMQKGMTNKNAPAGETQQMSPQDSEHPIKGSKHWGI